MVFLLAGCFYEVVNRGTFLAAEALTDTNFVYFITTTGVIFFCPIWYFSTLEESIFT